MGLTVIDIVVFVAFMGTVIVVSLYAGRKEKSSEDYFLAGRSLTWPLIGFSLIASNISTEHFVGMAGSAFGRVGLAIASYEWMAAVMLVLTAWFFLPRFLKAGIYTMPEFLEYRYDATTRSIMAVYLLAAYIIVFLATVVYSGAVGLTTIFSVDQWFISWFPSLDAESAVFWANVAGIWLIGIVAGAYTIYGGLKAVVWSDLLQGGALLIGGAIVTVLGMRLLGDGSLFQGWRVFRETNADKLHTVLPWNDPDVPWLAVFIGGLWIPNCFYWGLNQFITQRTLGAKSLAEGQKGIFLAALIKLAIPFIIVFPGIIAFQLYANEIPKDDMAYPFLIKEILPPSLRGAMFAALTGAVMSSFNSGINSASTIFTVDLYRKMLRGESAPEREVLVGRISTGIIMVVACLWAPMVGLFEGVFSYIQEIWGFITPGIVAVFLMGIILPRTPAIAARTGLLLSVPLYALCRIPKWIYDWRFQVTYPDVEEIAAPGGLFGLVYTFNSWAFLHHMAIVFIVVVAVMFAITAAKPLTTPVTMPVSTLDVRPCRFQYVYGGLIIGLTVVLYIIFW